VLRHDIGEAVRLGDGAEVGGGAGARGVKGVSAGCSSYVWDVGEPVLARCVQADVGDARLGEPHQVARVQQHAMPMIAGRAQHAFVIQQPDVDHLRDGLGAERRQRADLEAREAARGLIFGGQPQMPAGAQRAASAVDVESPARGDDGHADLLWSISTSVFAVSGSDCPAARAASAAVYELACSTTS
jgi:hypothetical protein